MGTLKKLGKAVGYTLAAAVVSAIVATAAVAIVKEFTGGDANE